MSKNTSTANTAAATAAKKVNKKSDAPAAVAEPVTPVKAEAKKGKAEAKADVKAAVASPVVAAPVAAVPVASVAAASSDAEVEVKSVDQEIAELIVVNQKLRDQAIATIKTLQKLQKRVAKDIKEAGRKRRRPSKKTADGEEAPKRNTIFVTTLPLKDDLCAFLGKPKGSQMTPADVTKAFSAYVKTHNLKDAQKGQVINPDAAMRKLFGLKEGDEFSYRHLQKVLYANHYVLPQKKKN